MSQSLKTSVAAFIAGDESAFENIYSAAYRSVFVAAKVLMKNEHDAKDATQDVFIRAYKDLKGLQNPDAAAVQWNVSIDGEERSILSYAIGGEDFFNIDDLAVLLDINAEYERPEIDMGDESGWFQEGNRWYFTKPDGTKAADEWQQIDDEWYYFKPDGSMATGWLQLEGIWYYLKPGGAMAKNETLTVDGKAYNFDKTGKCLNP